MSEGNRPPWWKPYQRKEWDRHQVDAAVESWVLAYSHNVEVFSFGYSHSEHDLASGIIAVMQACQPHLPLPDCERAAASVIQMLRETDACLVQQDAADAWAWRTADGGPRWAFGHHDRSVHPSRKKIEVARVLRSQRWSP